MRVQNARQVTRKPVPASKSLLLQLLLAGPDLCAGFALAKSRTEATEGTSGVSGKIRSGRYRRRLTKGFEGRLKVLVDEVGIDLRRDQVRMA